MAVCEEFSIYQGDTGPVLRVRPTVLDDGAVLDANWHCYIAVNDPTGAVTVASREVTDKDGDNFRWLASLTPAETATLPVDDDEHSRGYQMVIEVVNTAVVPPFNKEKHYTLKVSPQGIA